jgi:hypothetical protein
MVERVDGLEVRALVDLRQAGSADDPVHRSRFRVVVVAM